MPKTAIKDPVHGYIELDEFEQAVVDSPWFQRLRRVKQNDVAASVYPTMLTTRFEHSLGAMHLAGACLEAALSDDETRHNVDRFLEHFIRETQPLGVTIPRSDCAQFAQRCARMYGLLHDVGHPPYSHLLESCYSAREIGLPASVTGHWHEWNGREIVEQFLPSDVGATGHNLELLRVVSALARKDLSRLTSPALKAVKQLVDSVIDADRMDFVRRDGRASGSEFGAYDLLRLVDSFRVHVVESDGRAQTVLIRPLHKALSSIESLIQERYKIYRWVLFHHRVMQSRALMRYAIRGMKGKFDPALLRARNYVPPSGEAHGYVMLGDGYVDRILDEGLYELLSKRTDLTPDETKTLTALEILLLRRDYGTSLWKRSDSYSSVKDPNSFENHLRNAFRRVSAGEPHTRIEAVHGTYANWIASVLNEKVNAALREEIVSRMNANADPVWYLLETPEFKPTGDDLVLMPDDAGQFKSEHLSGISSVARATDSARKYDVHLFAFAFQRRELTKDEKRTAQHSGREKLARSIAEVYLALPGAREQLDPPP